MPTHTEQRGRQKGAKLSTNNSPRAHNSDLQQERSLPPQEQQRRARSIESGVAPSARSRTDVEGGTQSSAGSDFSGGGDETDERLHQEGIDGMSQVQRQDDGKVDVQTRRQPKYHSGKQTQR